MANVAVTPAVHTPLPRKPSDLRPDIQGLRAVAVLSVLVYHLRNEWLPGGFVGVDIFFVISGFLITAHLVREQSRTGTVLLRTFYSRRMVRLVPAATVVLLSTAVAVMLFVPRILWQQIGVDIIGSATYSLNWILASRSVDYLAEDSVVSPLQHFWSLAVEEQFYLIWPLLIIIAGFVALKLARPRRHVMAVGGVLIFAVSLTLALIAVQTSDVTAYFSSLTRLWELAAGGLAALTVAKIKRTLSNAQLKIVFYIGIAGIVGSIFLIAEPVHWPELTTVIPVVATALILIAGGSVVRTLPEQAISLRPMVWVGGIVLFGAVFAPTAAHALSPRELGLVIGPALYKLHAIGIVCGLMILLALRLLGRRAYKPLAQVGRRHLQR